MMLQMLMDRVSPQARMMRVALEVTAVVAGSLLIALSAQCAITIPGLVIPITGQTFGVLMVAAALGARRGMAAVALYLAEGAMGAPFFANGTFGVMVLAGPTSGYLFGFFPAAGLTGWLLQKRGNVHAFWKALLAMTAGTAVILACGSAWLTILIGDPIVALQTGVVPFLPGAVIKIAAAAALLPVAEKILALFCQQGGGHGVG